MNAYVINKLSAKMQSATKYAQTKTNNCLLSLNNFTMATNSLFLPTC